MNKKRLRYNGRLPGNQIALLYHDKCEKYKRELS